MTSSTKDTAGWSRRSFLASTVASTMTVTLLDRARGETISNAENPQDAVLNVKLRVNGRDHRLRWMSARPCSMRCASTCGLTGNKKGLRSRPVRRLHGACRRQARAVVPDACRDGRRPRGHHHRGFGQTGRRFASDAAGLHRSRRFPVRLLHARADHVGGRLRQ